MAGCLLGGALVAGCGVPIGTHPSPITHAAVPFSLLDPAASSGPPGGATTIAPYTSQRLTLQIYLVAPTSRLVAVDRVVPSPSDLVSILQALIAGPNSTEAATGLQGQIPAQTKVLGGTQIVNNVATVDLSAAFGQLAGQAQIQAIAQIVFTITGDLSGVTGVTFEIAGQPASVPQPDGALVNVATRAQYAALAPA
ncbi:MAG: GerMN domain-containing protein [Actinomycetota bacterium]|jgi:hypothetical protein|nr:GerMN domain-containing protein [Actinomycetota bacterium]